jgi:hypothetical protein
MAAFGVSLLLYPARFRDYALRYESNSWAWRVNPFGEWIKRPSYITFLRFMGVFVLFFAAILIAAAAFAR